MSKEGQIKKKKDRGWDLDKIDKDTKAICEDKDHFAQSFDQLNPPAEFVDKKKEKSNEAKEENTAE